MARFGCETKKRSKKGLKGKGVTLSDNLTRRRVKLYNKACKVCGLAVKGEDFLEEGR